MPETKSALEDFINFWRKFDTTNGSNIHPSDLEQLTIGNVSLQSSSGHVDEFEDYVRGKRFGDKYDTFVDYSLLPSPFVGDLSKAKVWLLMLNPGLHYVDVYAEHRHPERAELKRAMIANLHQWNLDIDFPFMYLNPAFCWHPGFLYWEGKLSQICRALMKPMDCNYRHALSHVSKQIACLELFPYHSKKFEKLTDYENLSSVQMAKNLAQSLQAMTSVKLIVVMRKAKTWGLAHGDQVHVFKAGAAQGAHLTVIDSYTGLEENKPAGSRILDVMLKHIVLG